MFETLAFAILTLVTALSISAVAIFYSVSGLVAIFSAAPFSTIILGGGLEIAKLVIVVWLHKFWNRINTKTEKMIRNYLCFGVALIMILTSVGIFGYLSKAHSDQTSKSVESVAQIQRINTEISRQQAIISRAEEKIKKTETTGSGSDVNIQSQIDREQNRIDSAFKRIREAEKAINSRLEPFKRELDAIDKVLSDLQIAINSRDIRKAQSIVGTKPDGQYGSVTAEKVEAFRALQNERRTSLLEKIESVRSAENPETKFAQDQINDSNKLIIRLREQLGTGVSEDLDAIIDEQSAKIKKANNELDLLTEKKYELESDNRKLVAEVGPIKAVAEFIYGATDPTILEKSVQWLIVLMVVVFDPLAVVLLIASQLTFNWYRSEEKFSSVPIAEDSIQAISDPDADQELIERIAEDFTVLEDPEVQIHLDSNPELRDRLSEFIETRTVVKPKEDMGRIKPGGWLDQ